MATLGPLSLIQNQTPADAIPVNQNFQDIQQHVNTELINSDGSIPMTGPLILSDGNPAISTVEAAAGVPVGLMMDWPAATPPAGGDWVLCDGQILTTADYPVLQALIGTLYDEPGDNFGGTQFRVPNLNGRSSVGPGGDLAGVLADSQGRPDPLVLAHTHTGPSHTHSGPSHTHTTPNHSHTINHGHGDNISASTNIQGSHTHSVNHDHSASSGGGGSHSHDSGMHDNTADLNIGSSAIASVNAVGPQVNTSTVANHTHTITVSARNAGSSLDGGHTHTVTVSGGVTNHSGSSGDAAPSTNASGTGATGASGTGDTGSTGTAGPKDNYHPVLVLNKIMKAR